MWKTLLTSILIILLLLVGYPRYAYSQYKITEVDFLEKPGLNINGTGPVLIIADSKRNKVITANTLSSSVSVIDGKTNKVKNIPLEGRALQHLKSEAITLDNSTGKVYLIGINKFYIIDPQTYTSDAIALDKQYESIAVDERTGNVFLTGRESPAMGFYDAVKQEFLTIDWLEHEEKLTNLNQTPPPPIRKIVADAKAGQIIAVDGFTSTIHVFGGRTGSLLSSRDIGLTKSGRWHLAGYNEQSRCLYIVTETSGRNVMEAAKINIKTGEDVIVKLPGLREGVGIVYNQKFDEVYIAYDNHRTVHVVGFGSGGTIDEISVPDFGNDAACLDEENDLLYLASWAHGEMEVVDVKKRKFIKRIGGLRIIPHMFAMAFNKANGKLYYPLGASAVNGCFGAAVTALDPATEKTEKIYTGWSPIDLIELPNRNSFLIFNNEDGFAEVKPDGKVEFHKLPYDLPVTSAHGPEGNILLSYGPHQSYWPNVYIWGAKNGILVIDSSTLEFYDRRIPRQAQQMAVAGNGTLYMTQNNWGREPQYLSILPDEIQTIEYGQRILTGDTVQRETTQRIMKYDKDMDRLYLVRIAEKDGGPSIFQCLSLDSNKLEKRLEIGINSTDLVFDNKYIYVANFGSNSISIINKQDFSLEEKSTGDGPLKLNIFGKDLYVLNHLGNTLQNITSGKEFKLPEDGLPNNLIDWNGKIVVTSHKASGMMAYIFNPDTEKFEQIYVNDYPYGETTFNTNNSSFYVSGQFGDIVYDLCKGKVGKDGRLWLTDFLAGKLIIIEEK